jgi:hypothetical protein
MKAQTLIRISGLIMVAVVVSLVMLALIYALQNQHLIVPLATIGWNR